MVTTVYFITAHFPYYPSECFIEPEIVFWQEKVEKNPELEVILMPLSRGTGEKRKIPNNIILDESLFALQDEHSRLHKIFRGITNLITGRMRLSLFRDLVQQKAYTVGAVIRTLKTLSSIASYYDFFEHVLNRNQNRRLIFYTYWFTPVTYALQLLKKKYKFRLYTRTHRYDLYEEEYPNNGYLPLRRQFTRNIDKVFTITESAKTYLIKNFGFNKSLIETERLGVIDRHILCLPSEEKVFHLVSCSYLVPVKRVDKIIQTVRLLAKTFDYKIIWSHIGDGPLKEKLKEIARIELESLQNVEYEFLGNLVNEEVYSFYKNNKVDAFINLSESEGVPVSIMEVMSCSIPIIATDVGGVSDQVTNYFNGRLFHRNCTVEKIVETIKDLGWFKNDIIRNNSKNLYLDRYSASNNFRNFINRYFK